MEAPTWFARSRGSLTRAIVAAYPVKPTATAAVGDLVLGNPLRLELVSILAKLGAGRQVLVQALKEVLQQEGENSSIPAENFPRRSGALESMGSAIAGVEPGCSSCPRRYGSASARAAIEAFHVDMVQ